ncbi:MAG: sodium:solute symporter family protein [Acidobacteriota bacterium]
MSDLTGQLLALTVGYLVLLIVLGWLGRRARKASTLSDHYLAGHSLGFLVLLLTLFATQYSGNSLSAFPGKTYRGGLSYFMSVTFMVAIVAGYLPFAPRLVKLARRRSYLTPSDYLVDRFGSVRLATAASVIFTVALCNYLLAQLIAMGNAFAGISDGAVPYTAGVIGGATIILIYELMGGMRAVAWTDMLQGGAMFIGIGCVVLVIWNVIGSPAEIVGTIAASAPQKVAAPSVTACITWISTCALLGFGAPLYPQAIQRLYAAASTRELRRSLAVMSFLPLFAVTAVVYIGLAGLVQRPGLSTQESDRITFLVLSDLVELEPLARLPVLLVMLAVVSAIMSTADSSLLSLSSIATKDFFARAKGLTDQQAEGLTSQARIISVVVMGLIVTLALRPPTTLWRLLEIKFEILIQLSPAFLFGTLHDKDDPRGYDVVDISIGLALGLVVGLTLYALGMTKVGGLHAGVIGLLVNFAAVLLSRVLRRRGGLAGSMEA